MFSRLFLASSSSPLLCFTIITFDHYTHINLHETKNKVELGLVDWFVDQQFSLIRSRVFASFNHLEKGIFRYQVRLIHTKGHVSVLDLFHSISGSTFQSSICFIEFYWVGWIMKNKKSLQFCFWVYITLK